MAVSQSQDGGSLLFGSSAKSTERLVADPKGALGFDLLYAPAEPLVDFIFVHGLGGGSRKTWSKTASEKDFWPQKWLPEDRAFKNVRIHSFGYDSDWAKGKINFLNIRHFGKSLLGQMSTLPCLRDTNTPIVLIGHSMGGLVIKKAYNLARQSAQYQSLANRVHSIYFLATPHSGSDSAKLLSDILQFASIPREYVAELKRDSGTIQTISDDFRNYERDLDLWSFYETLPLSMGKFFSRMIVPPDSAVIGFRDEKQMLMNADHRSICKFDSIADPNYQILRNSLESTVAKISKMVRTSQQDLRHSQLKDLERFLGVLDEFDNDLATAQEARLSGTCEWFSRKNAFLDWKNFAQPAPTVLWIGAKPAAGKSVLAGYACDYLQKENGNCSSFFFKHGDDTKSRLSACLRSLAYQMACSDSLVRQKLIEMQRDDIKFDRENERTIWSKLFVSGIFKATFSNHYWIIDALDECANSLALFDLMLNNLESSVPLRVLSTSRITGELGEMFQSLGSQRYQLLQISMADTLPDIRLLIQAKAKAFRLQNDDDRTALVEKILQKSNGSFLWTALVVNELSKCYSQEAINQVLDDVPSEMRLWYQRTLEAMSQNTHGRKLARAILIWATCATRPMSLIELDIALKLDFNETSHGLEQTVAALCGQLVAIDRLDRIQMVHETAREFLLDANLNSELAIKPIEAHTRIVKACLTYLTGDEMKPPRTSRFQSNIAVKRGHFSQYACTTFSYHLANADSRSNDILSLVDKFLKLNVLSWIEIIAQSQNLMLFVRVAKHFRSYLIVCSTERSPLSKELSLIRDWSTDLIRVTAKFADALVLSPSAIYSLILPFCPTASSVYQTANNGRRLAIVGLSNSFWDDRISCINYNQGQTSAISAGDQFLAVGFLNGTINLYHAASYQEYRSLNHGEAVKFLQFKEKSDIMASCGMKNIRVWDIRRGEIVHSFQTPQRPMCLAFDQDLVMAASQQNILSTWDLGNDGARKPDRLWNDSPNETTKQVRQQPCAISISVSHQMLAVAYSGKPILLWDLAGDMFYGNCGKKLSNGDTSTHAISALVFNPNINIGLLAVSYLDGQLAILDPFNDQENCSFRADCHTLAASSDGRLLAGGAGSGIIQVYEFDTLRLLYRVKSSNFYIKQLAFSPDGLHFSDIRGSQCNVWEPAVLLRDMVGDDSSEDSSTSVVEAISSDSKIRISAMILHQNSEVAFCGKEDGSISVYSVRTGVQIGTLYCHKSLVRILAWWPLTSVVMSVDTSNTIFAWKLQQGKPSSWKVDILLFQCHLDCSSTIIQVLPGEAVGKFILSTRESDHCWSICGREERVLGHSVKPRIRKWIQHPQSALHIICIDGAYAKIYSWDDWSEVSCVCLNINVEGLQLKSVFQFMTGGKPQVLLEMSELNGSANTRELYSINVALFNIDISEQSNIDTSNNAQQIQNNDSPDTIEVTTSLRSPIPNAIWSPRIGSQIEFLADYVSHIIGISESGSLVFLDTHSWVCSASLESTFGKAVSYLRHFFVPYDWFSGTREIVCGLAKRDVVFARNDDVAIIKGGLEFVEKVDVRLEPLNSKAGPGFDFGKSFTG
ncbi:related to NACHT and WD domain protein [Rhynchosporium graminicola]|uniref:GPI inositol-deacylase n=1 Tax=Rhynchosporium graminicola TaxID=2792576 RepID=A0A1E1L0B7_9HELO|nr:related to NACHT and WD domain protein [Rhynchosporium commune]